MARTTVSAECAPPTPVHVSPRRILAAAEIAVVVGLGALFLWRVAPQPIASGRAPWIVALLAGAFLYLAFVSARLFRDHPRERGLGTARTGFLRRAGLRHSASAYALLVATGTAVVLVATLTRDPGALARIEPRILCLKLAAYACSATVQQVVFGAWFCVRLRSVLAAGPAACRDAPDVRTGVAVGVVAGATFGVLHAPNPPLMLLGALGGFAFAYVQMRAPNLALAAASHAILGTLLHQVAGVSMRIGPFYDQPGRYFFRELFPVLKTWLRDVA